jgi:hypothetical protein
MSDVERPREVIALVHAERDVRWKELGSGDIADTIITELQSRGFVIVPREPTQAMCEAPADAGNAARAKAVWQAMIEEALK